MYSAARADTRPAHLPANSYEIHQGVHIHRVRATSLGRRSSFTRMADYLSFYARAVVRALRMPRFDAVVTLTTPPIIGLIGTLLRRLKGTSHIYWSMDLHPDASLALRRMSRRNPGGPRPRLALRPCLSPGRSGDRPGPLHGRSRAR